MKKTRDMQPDLQDLGDSFTDSEYPEKDGGQHIDIYDVASYVDPDENPGEAENRHDDMNDEDVKEDNLSGPMDREDLGDYETPELNYTEVVKGGFGEYCFENDSYFGKVIDIIDEGQVETMMHGMKIKYDTSVNPVAVIKLYAKSKSKDIYADADEVFAIPMSKLMAMDAPDDEKIVDKEELFEGEFLSDDDKDVFEYEMEGDDAELGEHLEQGQDEEEYQEMEDDIFEDDYLEYQDDGKSLSLDQRELILKKKLNAVLAEVDEIETLKAAESKRNKKKARYF